VGRSSSKPRKPHPQARKPIRSGADGGSSKSSLIVACVAIVVSAVAAAFTGLMYFNQRSANAASANAALEHDANRMAYYLGSSVGSSLPPLLIANRSLGPVRGMTIYLPEHVQGCSAKCAARGYMSFTLPDLPPCSIETTTILDSVVSPKIGPLTLAGSDLTFTDAEGHTWTLTGSGQLLHQPSPKPGTQGWSASATVKRANDCA
jgi:hypothetical protein